MLKNKDLKRILKSATIVVLALIFIWTSRFVFPKNMNNSDEILLRLTNQFTEISAPWLLGPKYENVYWSENSFEKPDFVISFFKKQINNSRNFKKQMLSR